MSILTPKPPDGRFILRCQRRRRALPDKPRDEPSCPEHLMPGLEDRHPWAVIGIPLVGPAVVLDGAWDEAGAKALAAMYEGQLEGYALVAVEEATTT